MPLLREEHEAKIADNSRAVIDARYWTETVWFLSFDTCSKSCHTLTSSAADMLRAGAVQSNRFELCYTRFTSAPSHKVHQATSPATVSTAVRLTHSAVLPDGGRVEAEREITN